MGAGQRLNALAEAWDEVVGAFGPPQRLAGDGLHSGERLPHPVIELAYEELLPPFGFLALRDVCDDSEDGLRISLGIVAHEAAAMNPDVPPILMTDTRLELQ